MAEESSCNADKLKAEVTVMYQNRTEVAKLRIFLKEGFGMFLEINTLDEIKVTRGVSCWLDLSTGNFRLKHQDEFSELPSMVVFHFNPGFDPEKVRFEQMMLKHATFNEYHSRPSFSDHYQSGVGETEHIYEDLDSVRSVIFDKEKIEQKTRNLLKQVTKIIEPLKPDKRKNAGQDGTQRKSPQSLSRSSSCSSSQPTPPGAIYTSDGEIHNVLHSDISAVNPGYVAPAPAFKIYDIQGKSPETVRKQLESENTPLKGVSRRPTKKPPPPPTPTIKPIPEKEEIYSAAEFLNSSPSQTNSSSSALSKPPPPPVPPPHNRLPYTKPFEQSNKPKPAEIVESVNPSPSISELYTGNQISKSFGEECETELERRFSKLRPKDQDFPETTTKSSPPKIKHQFPFPAPCPVPPPPPKPESKSSPKKVERTNSSRTKVVKVCTPTSTSYQMVTVSDKTEPENAPAESESKEPLSVKERMQAFGAPAKSIYSPSKSKSSHSPPCKPSEPLTVKERMAQLKKAGGIA